MAELSDADLKSLNLSRNSEFFQTYKNEEYRKLE